MHIAFHVNVGEAMLVKQVECCVAVGTQAQFERGSYGKI
jgi:hypothetical protein